MENPSESQHLNTKPSLSRKYLRISRKMLAAQSFAVLFFGIILLLVCNSASAGENLFEDGSFEAATPEGHPIGWIPLEFGWDVETAGNLFYVSRDAHTGNGSAAIVLDNFQKGWSACPVKGLKADTWYCLSAWTKCELSVLTGGGPTIFIFQHNKGDTRIGNAPDKFFGTFALGKAPRDWELMKLAFKTPADAGNIYAGMGLYDARGTALFDDMRLEEIGEAEAKKIQADFNTYNPDNALSCGKNLILNSSFEIVTASHMPDCWSSGMHLPGFKRDFYQAIKVVEDNPFHGKRCFMIKDGSMRYLGKLWTPKPVDSPSVLSMYLRTDQPGSECKISFMFKADPVVFKPDAEWKRYSLKLKPGGNPDFWLNAKGTVYVDAIQFETGETATEYCPSPCDQALVTPMAAIPVSPEVRIGAVDLNGAVPWNKGLAINSLKTEGGKDAKKPTNCFLVKAKDALHVRFECRGRPYDKLVSNIKKRDEYVFADDSVSVIINPGFKNGKDSAYIFDVNAANVQRDALGFDSTWNAEWKSSTGKLPDGYWVELDIPYAALSDSFAADSWQINLLRHSAATADERREVSAWFNPGVVPLEQTGMLVAGFDGMEKFKISIGTPAVELLKINDAAPLKLYAVCFDIGFPDKAKRNGEAVLSSPSGARYQTSWETRDGMARLSFTGLSEDNVLDIKTPTVTMFEKKIKIAEKQFCGRLNISPLLKIGHLDRSYYTGEAQAGLKIETAIHPSLAAEMELDVALLGTMKRIWHKRFPAQSGIVALDLPQSLAPGLYDVKVNLIRGNSGAKIFATGELPLTKLAPSPYGMEAKVNPISHMMVLNGKEHVNFGLDLYSGNEGLQAFNTRMEYVIPDIDEIKERFTGISPLENLMNKERGEVLPRFKEFVEKLRQAGLDVTLGMISTGKGGHLASEPNFFKNRFDAIEEYKLRDLPVIGYKEFDEAYGWWEKTPGQHESELLDFKWKLKELDPYRLLMTDTSLCGRVYGGMDHADWVNGSYYPISVYPPGNLPAGVRGFAIQTEKTRAEFDSPVVTGGFLPVFAYERGREPSPMEYRCCSYLMLIHGCRAMTLWCYKPFSQALWDSMIPLKKEMLFLSPILAQGEDVSSKISGSSRLVDFAAYKYQGRVYLIAANFSRKLLTASFGLSLLGMKDSVARECFENRVIQLKSGELTDSFGEYGCHVYEIK